MRVVKLPTGNEFRIRESQKELTSRRFTDFQKYVLQDVGIGSQVSDVDNHFKTLHKFLGSNMVEEAARESYNLHYNLYLMINKISIKHVSFGCLIDSVNETVMTDYSEKNLIDTVNWLGDMGLEEYMVSDILTEVKKNLIQN